MPEYETVRDDATRDVQLVLDRLFAMQQAEADPTPRELADAAFDLAAEVKQQRKEIEGLKASGAVDPAIKAAGQVAAQLAVQLADMRQRKDGAYLERNQVVALAARMAHQLGLRVGTTRTEIPGWDPEWHGCVYIDLPTGQVSWHYHDSQAELFADLPAYAGTFDGHKTPEKYRRVGGAFAPVRPVLQAVQA